MYAELEGLVLDGSDDSTPYTITRMTGIYDGVNHRRKYIERPTAHGTFPSIARLGGRRITIAGEIYTSSVYKQEEAIRRLTGLLGPGETGELKVHITLGTIRAQVQRMGAPVISTDLWGLLATYELTFWADDPRWYGEQKTTAPGASVQAVNEGNFPALPVLIVTGTAPAGYTITGPGGRQIIVTKPLVAGVAHEYHMRRARLYVGGAREIGAVSRAQLWAVQPGLPVTTMTISAGQLTAQLRDTYL